MKKTIQYFFTTLLLLQLNTSVCGQETILDTILNKVQEYVEETSNDKRVAISDQIMELNYGLTIEEANQIRFELEEISEQNDNPTYSWMSNAILGDVFYYKNQAC